MNYQRHYDLLIARAQNRVKPDCYTEKHHVVPRCLGGGNEKTNIIVLTAEEHFFAHELLIKIHPEHRMLTFAMSMLRSKKRHGRKMYAWLRARYAKAVSLRDTGKVISVETRAKLSATLKGRPNDALRGRTIPAEQRARISATLKGNVISAETRAKISAANKGKPKQNKGMKLSAAHIAKMSAAMKGRKVSNETRAKIAKSNTGKTASAETRAKQSAAKKGKSSHMRGKKHSDETRAKIKANRKRQIYSDETRAKMSAALKGRVFTEEHCAKLSAAQKGKPKLALIGKKRSPETIQRMCAAQQRIACERAAAKQQQQSGGNQE